MDETASTGEAVYTGLHIASTRASVSFYRSGRQNLGRSLVDED